MYLQSDTFFPSLKTMSHIQGTLHFDILQGGKAGIQNTVVSW